jgi:hypothetical protein
MSRLSCPCAPVLLALTLGTACGDDTVKETADTGTADTTAAASTTPDPTTGDPPADTTTTTSPPATSTGPDDPIPTGTSTTVTTGDPATTGDSTTGPDPAAESAPLFERGKLAQFDITLSPDAIASLDADAKLYVAGDLTVTVDGEVIDLTTIGVRLKGNYGSFRTLDQKAAFLLNFDRYVDKQKLLGLEKLAVNNMVQDQSMQREQLAYELFRAGDAPAPRAGHAVVTVNGEPYGLYTLVEAVDNEVFLEGWFGDDSGNLYEGAYGSDVFDDLITTFDQDNGDNIDFMDLKALADVLDAIVDPDEYIDTVDQHVDLDRYLTFAATEIYLGHWDGYAWTRNNFYMYRNPADDRWVWIPWGIDQIMVDYLDPFGGNGRLTQMCVASLECRMLLAEKFSAVVARVDQLALADAAQTLADALHAAAEADPRKEYPIDAVDGTVAANIAFLQNRGQFVLDALVCTDPTMVDEDGDGHSGCTDDCDDGDAAINPDAAEVCDLDDDNCNGVWDDDPMCPQCVVKPMPAPATGDAAFCFVARDWTDAEADCVDQGGHLISIHSNAVQDFVTSEAFAIADTDWWTGLSDLASEGDFVWSDGSPFNYESWAGGEPNNAGEEDCANVTPWVGGDWNDLPCDSGHPYVCRLP